jgi:hypothetical protein
MLAIGLAMLAALLRSQPNRRSCLFLVGVPALFMTAAILLSFRSPFLIPRITIWMSVPFCLLAAIAICQSRPRWLGRALAVLLLLCSGLGLYGVYAFTPRQKEDWRGLIAGMSEAAGPADLIVLGPHTSLLGPVLYGGETYRQRLQSGGFRRWRPADQHGTPILLYVPDHPMYLPDHLTDPQEISTLAVLRAAQARQRVWLLLNEEDWKHFGAEILAALPTRPRVDQDHAKLAVVQW